MLFISYTFNYGTEENYFSNVILEMDKPKSKKDIDRLERILSNMNIEDGDEAYATVLNFQEI
jgi:predicted CopG family antitoxin